MITSPTGEAIDRGWMHTVLRHWPLRVSAPPREWLTVAMLLAAPASPTAQEEASASRAVATFAGGCFWCMEPPFDELDGVLETVSGYMGGEVANPSYEQVSGGGTGHAEVVQVTYDPSVISYQRLLEVFWRNIDPHDAGGQFCDRGDQYRSAIFVHSDDQRLAAAASKARVEERLPAPVVTTIVEAGVFYRAEEYHQDYYVKNPLRYRFYKWRCGRDDRLEDVWSGVPAGRSPAARAVPPSSFMGLPALPRFPRSTPGAAEL